MEDMDAIRARLDRAMHEYRGLRDAMRAAETRVMAARVDLGGIHVGDLVDAQVDSTAATSPWVPAIVRECIPWSFGVHYRVSIEWPPGSGEWADHTRNAYGNVRIPSPKETT